MDNPLSYAVAMVYTGGVLVTGVWIVDPELASLTPFRIGMLLALAVGWSAYFGWTVGPRLVDLETEDEEEEEDEGDGGNAPSPMDPEV